MNAEFLVPPHSLESEQSLLGALLLDNRAWERVADVITARDFYKGEHRHIYEQIELLISTKPPADVVTVWQAMQDAGLAERSSGVAYLGSLAQAVPSALHVRRYAEIVREKAVQRNLIRICSEITEQALQHGAVVDDLIEAAESRIFELRFRRERKQPVTFKQVLGRVFEAIDRRFHASDLITGLRSGFDHLDRMLAGLQPGDLIILAGRPSMGKTALAMNITENVVLDEKKPVAVFSIEMADEQLAQRMLGSVGRIDQHKLRTGKLTDADWAQLSNAIGRLNDAPVLLEETAALTINELRARARRLARDNPALALIVIDYLQLMAKHGQSQSERTAEIGDISRGLKALSKELNIPILALSQLNRGVEQRVDKRPLMSDLRDSGALEQDADVVVFMYRDIVYHQNTEFGNVAEIIVGKQRNGPTGTTYLSFVKEMTRFENLGADWTPPRKEKRKKSGYQPPADQPKQRADIDG